VRLVGRLVSHSNQPGRPRRRNGGRTGVASHKPRVRWRWIGQPIHHICPLESKSRHARESAAYTCAPRLEADVTGLPAGRFEC
jgi:hypothetical protein